MRREADEQAPEVRKSLTDEEIVWIRAFYRPGASRVWSDYEGMPRSVIQKGLVEVDWNPWSTYLGAAVARLLNKEDTP